jgi:hypothetical protein
MFPGQCVDVPGQLLEVQGQVPDAPERRLNALGQLLDALGEPLDGLEQRLDALEQTLDVLGLRLDVLGQPLDAPEQHLDFPGQQFDAPKQLLVVLGQSNAGGYGKIERAEDDLAVAEGVENLVGHARSWMDRPTAQIGFAHRHAEVRRAHEDEFRTPDGFEKSGGALAELLGLVEEL